MHRVSVKIERLLPGRMPVRGPSTEDKLTPELTVISTGDTSLAAMDKAIRILTGERNALIELEESKKANPSDSTHRTGRQLLEEEDDEDEGDEG